MNWKIKKTLGNVAIVGESGGIVAKSIQADPLCYQDSDVENAQLMASAPLLLEACKMALIEYRGLKDETDLVKLGCDGNDDACTNMLNYAIYEASNV